MVLVSESDYAHHHWYGFLAGFIGAHTSDRESIWKMVIY
jgi:hypothetical protein